MNGQNLVDRKKLNDFIGQGVSQFLIFIQERFKFSGPPDAPGAVTGTHERLPKATRKHSDGSPGKCFKVFQVFSSIFELILTAGIIPPQKAILTIMIHHDTTPSRIEEPGGAAANHSRSIKIQNITQFDVGRSMFDVGCSSYFVSKLPLQPHLKDLRLSSPIRVPFPSAYSSLKTRT